jgi:hypothetical protein
LGKWWWRAVIALVVLIPLSVLAFFVGMRFVGPTPAQAAALRVLRAPTPPVQGHDASDAVWLLDYDVPLDKRAQVAAATRRFASAQGRAGTAGLRDPRLAFAKFAAAPPPFQGVCDAMAPGCLAYVQDNRAIVAAELDANRAAVDAALEVAAYDGFRMGVSPSLSGGIPSLGTQRRRVLARFALRFASGERLSAVEAVCRDIAGWRRVGGNADNLVVSMVGASFAQHDLPLLADMLAKMPKETDLPESCAAALESSADFEFDLCPSMRADFAALSEPANYIGPDRQERPWSIDWNNYDAMVAEGRAGYCGARLLRGLRADHLGASLVGTAPRCSKWRGIADPQGCILAGIAEPGPATSKYLDRRADLAQALALMRTVVWLRVAAESPDEVPNVLAKRPASLGLLREPGYDAEHDRISIPMHDTSRGARFELDAGAEPRPVHVRGRSLGRRRGLALLD